MTISKKLRVCSTRNKKLRSAIGCALLIPLFCYAQQSKLTVKPPAQLTIQRGASATETLKVTVAPGLHVNNDKPRDEFLIPLKLTWDPGQLEIESIQFPKPEEIRVGGQALTVFTGAFDIETRFRAKLDTPPGEKTLHGKLRYQACNDQMCFRPATAEIELPISVK